MDDTKPEWLLVMYVTIAMTFFTVFGYSVGNVWTGIKFGVFISLATSVSIGFRMVVDHYARPSVSEEKQP
jgi:hypothetical protein